MVDEYTVNGSQDGPVSVTDDAGTVLWTQPGKWVYSDVRAVDDGAVFAVETAASPGEATRLVAYEIPTGEVRWEHVGDPYGEGLWPWHAHDGRLYTMWTNVQVRDTATGDVIWATEYPPSSVDRFAGVAVDDEAVYVGYATGASGGD